MPPSDLITQIALLVRRWPTDGFAREKVSSTQRRLVWLDGRVLGELTYDNDDVQSRKVIATIRPLAQIRHVELEATVRMEQMKRRHWRKLAVHLTEGDTITVDTANYTNDSLRDHAERFIDNLLDALAGAGNEPTAAS